MLPIITAAKFSKQSQLEVTDISPAIIPLHKEGMSIFGCLDDIVKHRTSIVVRPPEEPARMVLRFILDGELRRGVKIV